MNNKLRAALGGLAIVLGLSACGKKDEAPAAGQAAAEEKVLNLYIWNDYLADDTIPNFEKETGIKVMVSNYGSNEELDAKLAPGNSGYDIVVPSASTYERQIMAGYYQKLDKSKLPNLENMDSEIQERLALQDPNNDYAVLHMWGTTGIGYSECSAGQLAAGVRSGRRQELPEVRHCRARFGDRDVHHGSCVSRQGSEQPESG